VKTRNTRHGGPSACMGNCGTQAQRIGELVEIAFGARTTSSREPFSSTISSTRAIVHCVLRSRDLRPQLFYTVWMIREEYHGTSNFSEEASLHIYWP
jgi:hypothetical protein